MTAQGRSSEAYRRLGNYYTRDAVAGPIVDQVVPRVLAGRNLVEPRVIEPSAGGGAFVRAIRRRFPLAYLHAFDVDPDAWAVNCGWTRRYTANRHDFLRLGRGGRPITEPLGRINTTPFHLVIGNPPFGIHPEAARELYPELEVPPTRKKAPVPMAERHARQALELAAPHGASVVFVLRMGFLAHRVDFWREWPLRKLWVVDPRPGFSGGKKTHSGRKKRKGETDSSTYGVFWWDTGSAIREPLGWLQWV